MRATVEVPRERYDVELTASDLDLGRWLERPQLAGRLSGALRLTGSGFEPSATRGEARLTLAFRSQLGGVAITSGRADLRADAGRLTIETRDVEIAGGSAPPAPPGRYVMLAVSDEGVGIDAETLQRIFEPFFTTKPEGEGSGLGLATVHDVVHEAGGSIRVDSEPGPGTTFRIYLPCAAEAAEPQPSRLRATRRARRRTSSARADSATPGLPRERGCNPPRGAARASSRS